MTLGERIRCHRQRNGLSQEKAAELIGVSRQAVTKWEKDQSAPSTENLFRLAQLFGTTVDMLLPQEQTAQEQVLEEQVSEEMLAEELWCLQKREREERRLRTRTRYLQNLKTAALIGGGYLAVYLIGRLICADRTQTSLLGFLAGTDSRYYLFDWLIHQRIYWLAMAFSALAAAAGRRRTGLLTFAAAAVGIPVGEILGPNPEGAALGQGHYGWLIWWVMFLAAGAAGSLWDRACRRAERKNGSDSEPS